MGISDMFHDFFFGPANPTVPNMPNKDRNPFFFKERHQTPNIQDEEDFDVIFSESFSDMQKHMDMMQREMEAIFRGFGGMHIPFDGIPDIPGGVPESDNASRGNPRDFMLKEPESSPDHQLTPKPPRQGGFHHFFDDFFHKFSPQEPVIKEDKDLDREGENIDLSQVFTDPRAGLVPSAPQRGGFFSRGSSVSVTTIRGADGKIEQKKTVRDSSGREETTVTRTMGDKSHSVTTRVDPSGIPETTETFTNIDEDKKKDFDENWKQPSRSPTQPLLPPESPPFTIQQIDGNSLLDRIFKLRIFGPKDDN